MIRPPRHVLEIFQNPAAAVSSARLGANSSVRQKNSASSKPTKITRLASWGLGTRLSGFQTRSSSNRRAIPEWAASSVKKYQVVWRYRLGLLVVKTPSRSPSWISDPRSAVGVRSSKRMEMAGSSSLITSQTTGKGVANPGVANSSESSRTLTPPSPGLRHEREGYLPSPSRRSSTCPDLGSIWTSTPPLLRGDRRNMSNQSNH